MSEQSALVPADDLSAEQLNALPIAGAFGQRVINTIEQFWATSGKLLASKQIANLLGVPNEQVTAALEHPTVLQALRVKGIITSTGNESLLSSKQLLAANMILTRADRRTFREKLKTAGVTVSEWNGWFKQKAFKDYIEAKAGSDFVNSEFQAYKTILDAVEEGDLTATKMYLEMRGKYAAKVDVNINFSLLFTQVVEIVAKYVSSEQLEELATELETVYSAHTGRQLEAASGN